MMNARETDKAKGIDNARDRILCDPLHPNKPTEGVVDKPTEGSVDSILRRMNNLNKKNSQEFRDPGPYDVMYKFIVVGLLNAVEGSAMRIALDSILCDNLWFLIELIRKPGLIISLRWNGEKLSNEQCRELLALDSFINYVRNESMDITTMTRKDFLHFIHEGNIYYGIDDHIAFSEEEAAESHKYLISENYKPVSDRIVKLLEAIDTLQFWMDARRHTQTFRVGTLLSCYRITTLTKNHMSTSSVCFHHKVLCRYVVRIDYPL